MPLDLTDAGLATAATACRAMWKRAAKAETRASSVVYSPRAHALRVALTNGVAVALPVRLIPELRRVARRDLRAVEILGRGGGLHWESRDVDLSIPGLLTSRLCRTRMADRSSAASGGENPSAAKAAAARRNGRKGGRPRSRSRATPMES